MSNQKGNVYKALFINSDNQLMGQTSDGKSQSLSTTGYAMDIGIAIDGTIWAVTLTPDPQGGNVLAWSNGDGNWTEINNGAPGACKVTGASNMDCYYITNDDDLWYMNTQGTNEVLYAATDVALADYGGGQTWAMLPINEGDFPVLQSNTSQQVPFTWNVYAQGLDTISALSVSYDSDLYGIIDNSPVYIGYESISSAGSGADGISIDISVKNNIYVLTSKPGNNGNAVMIWVDVNGGTFQDAGFDAIKVLSTYYL